MTPHPLAGKSRRELEYLASSVSMTYQQLLRRIGVRNAVVFPGTLVRWWL